MNVRYVALSLLLLSIAIGSVQSGPMISEASATPLDPDPGYTTLATDDNWTLEGSFHNLTDSVFGLIPKFIEIIFNLVTAPIRAIADVFARWGGTLGGWYGPIVAAFVIIVVLLIVRVYSEIDSFLDKSDDPWTDD